MRLPTRKGFTTRRVLAGASLVAATVAFGSISLPAAAFAGARPSPSLQRPPRALAERGLRRGGGRRAAPRLAAAGDSDLLGLDLQGDSATAEDGAASETLAETVRRWLDFLAERATESGGESEIFADHSGFPLEHALELLASPEGELSLGGSTLLTRGLPEGIDQALGPVGWIMAVRRGEDLDLSLLGGEEWDTLHLDLLAANPLISWASEAAVEGQHLLCRLLASAAKARRAVTVAPLTEQVKEQFRSFGFQEDSFIDPTLMFWVPSEEQLATLSCQGGQLAYRVQ